MRWCFKAHGRIVSVKICDYYQFKAFVFPFVTADLSKPIVGADFLGHFGLWVNVKNQRLMNGSIIFKSSGRLLSIKTGSPSVSSVCTTDVNPVVIDLLKNLHSITQSSIEI